MIGILIAGPMLARSRCGEQPLAGQCCPGDVECRENPRDHDAACGNRRVMDPRGIMAQTPPRQVADGFGPAFFSRSASSPAAKLAISKKYEDAVSLACFARAASPSAISFRYSAV